MVRQNLEGSVLPSFWSSGFDRIVKGYASLSGRFGRTDIKCVSSTAPESVFSDDCIEVCALHDASKTAVVPLWLTNGVVDLLSDDESSSSSKYTLSLIQKLYSRAKSMRRCYRNQLRFFK